jgi:hypothetical protein
LRTSLRSTALFALVAGITAAALLAGTGVARADYGAGAVHQVEISANTLRAGSFWLWAELDPSQTSGDYQETDCIHEGAGGMNGAAHDSGSVTFWSDTGGMLTMKGIEIIGGLETATFAVSDASHSNSVTITITAAAIPNPPIPVGASFTISGQGVQVEVAP